MRGKILIIRGGAIGDFILTLPAIAALRSHFPEAQLEILGYPHIAQLALAAGLVDRVQPIEARALAGFFARNGELSKDLTDYFSEFDLILSYLYDPDEIFQTNVRLCTVAQFIVGPHRASEDNPIPASQSYLKPLERVAIFDPEHIPRLTLQPQRQIVKQVALHPGSGSDTKNWPEDKWAVFLRHLERQTDYQLLLIGGEAEGQRLRRLAAKLPPDRVHLAQSLPLVELAKLIQSCALFIGHDSGISHLAAALGLPGIVLWGHTVEEIWRPPSEKIVVLRNPRSLAELEIKTVIEAFEQVSCGVGSRLNPGFVPEENERKT